MEDDVTPPQPLAGPAPFASAAATWLADRRTAVVARAIGLTELGPAVHGEVLVMAEDGERAGGLLRGAADPALAAACARLWRQPGPGWAVAPITVPFDDAVTAGLTCGGTADVLLQRLELVPAALWEGLSANAPAVLARRPGATPCAMLACRTPSWPACTGPLGSTWAPARPWRAPSRSWPRSSPCGPGATPGPCVSPTAASRVDRCRPLTRLERERPNGPARSSKASSAAGPAGV